MPLPPFHVWVVLTGAWSGRMPGIVLATRTTDKRGLEFYVVTAEGYSTGDGREVTSRISWVPAHLVKPTGG